MLQSNALSNGHSRESLLGAGAGRVSSIRTRPASDSSLLTRCAAPVATFTSGRGHIGMAQFSTGHHGQRGHMQLGLHATAAGAAPVATFTSGRGHMGMAQFSAGHGQRRMQLGPHAAADDAAGARPGAGSAIFHKTVGHNGLASFSNGHKPVKPPAPPVQAPSPAPARTDGAPGANISFRTGRGNGGLLTFRQPNGEGSGVRAPSSMADRLASFGLAGVVAYGLLNTAYYTVAFCVFWNMAKVPAGQGMAAAARAFAKVMAATWAGSQVTKAARIAGALFLSPAANLGLDWIQSKFKLQSKRQAFAGVATVCVCVALALFGAVVVAWA